MRRTQKTLGVEESFHGTGSILIIDDEAAVCSMLSTFLHRQGYIVATVPGMTKAREVLAERGPTLDVIISDVMMPDGNGVEVLDLVKELACPIPVILLTGYADLDLAISGIRKDAFDLLTKPPDLDRLARAVEHAVNYRRLLHLERNYTVQLEDEVCRKTGELMEHQDRLTALAAELSRVEEHERRRLATELHDGIGQTLAFMKIKLGAIPAHGLSSEQQQMITEGLCYLEEAIGAVRALTVKISPPLLYEVGLEVALKSLGDSFAREHKLAVTVEGEAPGNVSEEQRGLLYQAVRELLVNVVKHAHASCARVSLASDGCTLCVSVEDDGCGFAGPIARKEGFGLFNIRQRVERAGGTFWVENERSRGSRVTFVLPLNQQSNGGD